MNAFWGPKRSAAKFHAEPRYLRAEINFLDLFREEAVLGTLFVFQIKSLATFLGLKFVGELASELPNVLSIYTSVA